MASERGGPVLEIRELKVSTPDYYNNILHCSFNVRTASDGWIIFDPTGVQFGPQWPLICALPKYLQGTDNENHYSGFFEESPLGTNRVSRRRHSS